MTGWPPSSRRSGRTCRPSPTGCWARRARPETALGPELPEPIVSIEEAGPEHEALLADSVALALLVVLDTLTPAERLAFVLHDMFSLPFEEIGAIVDRSPAAARQLASR